MQSLLSNESAFLFFSYPFSSNHFIFNNFLSPTHKIKTQDKHIYLTHLKLTSFIFLGCYSYQLKNLLVLFLEHFIKISLVDVFCVLNPYLSELKVGSLSFSPSHKIASSQQQILANLFSTLSFHIPAKRTEKYTTGNHLTYKLLKQL